MSNAKTDPTVLPDDLRRRCLFIGVYLIVLLVAALTYVGVRCWGTNPSTDQLQGIDWFVIPAVAGVFGGATRSLMMLVVETGVHDARRQYLPEIYLSRWPLYGFKPFIGAATGLLFLYATIFGLVRVFASDDSVATRAAILPVFLVSATGGLFFEEVLNALERLVSRERANKTGAIAKSDDGADHGRAV